MKVAPTYLVLTIGFTLWSFAFSVRSSRPISNPYRLTTFYDTLLNPPTEEGFKLGRALFYENMLSADSSINCSSCHLSVSGFTHVDHTLSHGVNDRIGKRNSIALMNLIFKPKFMWDGAANNLEAQPLIPLSSHAEMDLPLEQAIKRLNNHPGYRKMFHRAFKVDSINTSVFLKAFAQFTMQLNTFNAKYDRIKQGLDHFSIMEQKGYKVFKKACSSCHQEPLFTNNQFESNGLKIDPILQDSGRAVITQQTRDVGKFSVPTLRNIEYTFPYMHDGRFEHLKQVIEHYRSGDAYRNSGDKRLKHAEKLTPNQNIELIAFLKTLTDRAFLFNPDFRNQIP